MKSVVRMTLAAVLTLAVSPAIHAERAGCNPRPAPYASTVNLILTVLGL